MKAPNEIYLSPSIAHPRKPSQVWFNHEVANGVKYIRADLAELTWVHIWKIWDIIEQVKNDFCDNPKIFKLKEVTPEYFKQAYGEEVLRRLNEYKAGKK